MTCLVMIAAAEPVANGHAVPVHHEVCDTGMIMTVAHQKSVLLGVFVIEVGNIESQESSLYVKDSVMLPCNETLEDCHCCADAQSKQECLPSLPGCA